MRKILYLLLCSSLLLMMNGCYRSGCTDYSACNYDPNATRNDGSCYYNCGSGNCYSYTYTGSGSCSSGYVLVPGGCCPSSSPYSCSGAGCYSSCSAASSVCSTVYQGSSGSGTCSYSYYTGSGTCSSGYVLVPGGCCPSSSPYSCSGAGCYSTCSAAAAYCSVVYKGL